MLRTVQFACTLPKDEADALNAESGRLYTDMLVCHYRIYRRQGIWLRPDQGERWEDRHGGPTTLHAHSRDAALRRTCALTVRFLASSWRVWSSRRCCSSALAKSAHLSS